VAPVRVSVSVTVAALRACFPGESYWSCQRASRDAGATTFPVEAFAENGSTDKVA
jgi:hypothetical protein